MGDLNKIQYTQVKSIHESGRRYDYDAPNVQICPIGRQRMNAMNDAGK